MMTQIGGVGDIVNQKMMLPENFIETLSPEQISYLGKLQLELENCTSSYRIISVYNKSLFIKSLNEKQKEMFKSKNLETLKDMDIVNPTEAEVIEAPVEKKKGKQKKISPLNLANLPRNV